MKKAVFIILYFGKFNNYFQLFLNSCSYNKEYDWLIFTDDKFPFDYPENVKVIYTDFKDITKEIQNKFDFKINLKRPYKLCDFKPAYGYIFEKYIKEYPYWGHCDTDLIFGDIDYFLKGILEKKYDKIGILGHCTLYKNNYTNNRIFKSKINKEFRYKVVYSSEKNFSFDEEFNDSINTIFENENKSIYYREHEANIYTKSSQFKIIRLSLDKKKYEVETKKNGFFIWNKGKLIRYKKEENKIDSEEFMYLHMQSRKMDVRISENDGNICYKIIPNAFEKLEFININENNFEKIKKYNINFHYFRLRGKNLYLKLKNAINIGLGNED